jgi:deoxyhypusine synthase
MIREDKIHAICSTAANLEEDIYNLVAHKEYKQIPKYHQLTPSEETQILNEGFARVTDTAIPDRIFNFIDKFFLELCQKAQAEGKRYFPYEYFYQMLDSGVLKPHYQVSAEDSWVMAAWEKKIPIYTPGWEDSSTGNSFEAWMVQGKVKYEVIRTGLEQMVQLMEWYLETDKTASIGFFQIGGGIAGDFSICSVPIPAIDFPEKKARLWGYFAQISDSTTSYGSYSGAVPNEKISWFKLEASTPRFFINSDATLVAPLIFGYVLGD